MWVLGKQNKYLRNLSSGSPCVPCATSGCQTGAAGARPHERGGREQQQQQLLPVTLAGNSRTSLTSSYYLGTQNSQQLIPPLTFATPFLLQSSHGKSFLEEVARSSMCSWALGFLHSNCSSLTEPVSLENLHPSKLHFMVVLVGKLGQARKRQKKWRTHVTPGPKSAWYCC